MKTNNYYIVVGCNPKFDRDSEIFKTELQAYKKACEFAEINLIAGEYLGEKQDLDRYRAALEHEQPNDGRGFRVYRLDEYIEDLRDNA